MEKVEERNVLRYETDKMIDFATLAEKEPELFKELCEDYPVEQNTILIFTVKGKGDK